MATATKQARSARKSVRSDADGAPSEFLVFENNGGDYQWAILAAGGATLAQSGVFKSFDEATRAATAVRDGAASARFAPRDAAAPAALA
jgi:uncharacterized protein YegP (UPF0339 family)